MIWLKKLRNYHKTSFVNQKSVNKDEKSNIYKSVREARCSPNCPSDLPSNTELALLLKEIIVVKKWPRLSRPLNDI